MAAAYAAVTRVVSVVPIICTRACVCSNNCAQFTAAASSGSLHLVYTHTQHLEDKSARNKCYVVCVYARTEYWREEHLYVYIEYVLRVCTKPIIFRYECAHKRGCVIVTRTHAVGRACASAKIVHVICILCTPCTVRFVRARVHVL